MSTHAMIGFIENGSLTINYCHFDGYPANPNESGVGQILLKHFKSKDAVRQLVVGNYIDSIKQDGYVRRLDVADGVEQVIALTKIPFKKSKIIAKFFKRSPAAYAYLFVNNHWYWKCRYDKMTFELWNQKAADRYLKERNS